MKSCIEDVFFKIREFHMTVIKSFFLKYILELVSYHLITYVIMF